MSVCNENETLIKSQNLLVDSVTTQKKTWFPCYKKHIDYHSSAAATLPPTLRTVCYATTPYDHMTISDPNLSLSLSPQIYFYTHIPHISKAVCLRLEPQTGQFFLHIHDEYSTRWTAGLHRFLMKLPNRAHIIVPPLSRNSINRIKRIPTYPISDMDNSKFTMAVRADNALERQKRKNIVMDIPTIATYLHHHGWT